MGHRPVVEGVKTWSKPKIKLHHYFAMRSKFGCTLNVLLKNILGGKFGNFMWNWSLRYSSVKYIFISLNLGH